jgi:hypothetical protein
MSFAKNVVVLITLATITMVGNLDAFERDTHYYLTFALSMSTCFDWDEAHIIASADWMTDNNRTTAAEMTPLRKRNKRSWHAFGHSHERYNELWQRVVSEPDELRRLVKLGQFLHFLQDWEAHARFPVGIGHAAATIRGNDPDSIARSEPRTAHAAQATLDHLALMCSELGRLPEGYDDPDEALVEFVTLLAEDRLIWDLVETSKPNWRARLKGGLTREGRRVMARNIYRIEEYVERRIADIPEKNVPHGFRAGSDEHGIPETLELDYDSDGDLLWDLTELEEDAGEQPENDGEDPPNDSVRVKRVKWTPEGWLVVVEVKNTGDTPLPKGTLVFIAVDPFTQELLGEESSPLPKLRPGREVDVEVVIPTTRTAETILLGVSARVAGDHDLYNNDLWFMSSEDYEELEDRMDEDLESTVTLPANVEIEFLEPPKVWITSAKNLCVSSRVRTSTSDLTNELEPARINLLIENRTVSELTGYILRQWSITPTRPGEPGAAKTFACFNTKIELCGLMEPEDLPVELVVTAQLGTFQSNSGVHLDPTLLQRLRTSCEVEPKASAGTTSR